MSVIIIFGPPGAGKGTQAELLCKKLNFLHFSTGTEFRKEIAKKTLLGKELDDLMSKGNLVSDELSITITKNFLTQNRGKNILLDGYPRTLNQIEILLKILEELKINDIKVINLQVDDKELVNRILKRAEIEHRADDNRETVTKRLEVYYTQTKPILDFLKAKKIKIFNFDGQGEIEEIQKEIIEKIK